MTAALTRPNVIARIATVIAGAIAVVAIVLSLGGGSSYVLKLAMANASGLRVNSQVLLGGVPVGNVSALNFDQGANDVIVTLHLNPGDVHIGKGAGASVLAANLLGEEYIALTPGNASDPLPSGTQLTRSATKLPTALDRVIDVLDGSTRARLAILLDEGGQAVAGRRSDIQAILRQLPLSLTAATQLLTTMVQDNHTLADLVSNGNSFISQVNAQTPALKRVIDAAGAATTVLSARAGQLAQLVADGPRGLISVDHFFTPAYYLLREVRPELSEIESAAPQLVDLLKSVKPFTNAAVPALDKAAAVAPTLSSLANQATPIVTQAVPTVASLENIAGLASPLSAWLGLSAPELINAASDWPQSIQSRDGLSHVFNGDLYLDPSIVVNAANTGATAAQRCQNLIDVLNTTLLRTTGLLAQATAARQQGCHVNPNAASKPPVHKPSGSPLSSVTKPVTSTVGNLGSGVNKVLGGVGKVLGGVTKTLGGTVSKTVSGVTSGLSHAVQGITGPGGSTGASQSGSNLGHLLNYLLGK